jgi:hypothetical protein
MTVVIVSLMDVVHAPSLKDLHKVLICHDREMRKFGERMSETVIKRDEEMNGGGIQEEAERMIRQEAE